MRTYLRFGLLALVLAVGLMLSCTSDGNGPTPPLSGETETPTPDGDGPTPPLSDETATPGGGEGEVIFYDDFSSLDKWDTSSYHWHPWKLDDSCESPPCAAYISYRHDEDAWLYRPFTLPNTSPITLRFRVWYDTEPKFDYLAVWVNREGLMDYKEVAEYSGSSSGFEQHEVDLTAYAGESIALSFTFTSDDRDYIPEGGVRIDDVEVRIGGTPAPQPTRTEEPSVGTVVTREECERVQLGMTYAEVVDIVGAEGEYYGMTNVWGYDSYTWMNPNGSNMVLWFGNDVVQIKSPCDYTFPER